MTPLQNYFRETPLVAILRGIPPDEAVPVGQALYDEGFRCIEIPLNSPTPLVSIGRLAKSLPHDCLIGAGTVMSLEQVKQVSDCGGKVIVMPHSDPRVIKAVKSAGLLCLPGVATPTEAFAALDNGADGLKLFPGEQIPPEVVKAWRAVVPREIALLPVGGVSVERMGEYWKAGASGFGLGSALYRPGADIAAIKVAARAFVTEIHALKV